MTYLIDSSVYISALNSDDVLQPTSQTALSIIQKSRIIVPTLIISEIITVLNKTNPKATKSAVRSLLNHEVITLDIKFIHQFSRRIRSNNHLKTSDLIIAITALIYKATLITWDKQLINNTKSWCVAVTPTQIKEQYGINTK